MTTKTSARHRPTTDYGSWESCTGGSTKGLRADVGVILGEFADHYDLDGLTDAYRDAINDALAGVGITLNGDEFYGPHPRRDDVDIAAIVGTVDFWTIAERHDRNA